MDRMNCLVVSVEKPENFHGACFKSLQANVLIELIIRISREQQYVFFTLFDDCAREPLGRLLWGLGISRGLGLLVSRLLYIWNRGFARRQRLWRRLRFLQLRPGDQFPGCERVLRGWRGRLLCQGR